MKQNPPHRPWELPLTGWKGYGNPCRDTVAMHEWHSEVAEYRLRHDGILPELEQYVAGICREAVR